MAATCRVRDGSAQWEHHPEALAEIELLRASDVIAWQTPTQLFRRASSKGVGSARCRCRLKSPVHPVGEIRVEDATDPAITVRFYFAELPGMRETLGLHVSAKPSTYDDIGADATRSLQNESIMLANDRVATHPCVVRSRYNLQ